MVGLQCLVIVQAIVTTVVNAKNHSAVQTDTLFGRLIVGFVLPLLGYLGAVVTAFAERSNKAVVLLLELSLAAPRTQTACWFCCMCAWPLLE